MAAQTSTADQHEVHARVLNAARSSWRDPLALASAARAARVKPRTLQRTLARSPGTTLGEELAVVRLSAAAELLSGQAISVALVAHLVGYTGPSAFARAFRRRYGLTPSRYRAAARTAKRTLDPHAGPNAAAPISSPTTIATGPSW